MTNHATVHKHEKAELGFWLYLMTDVMLFATLFATYLILRNNIASGPAGSDIFEPKFVLLETIMLLTSSFTAGLALVSLRNNRNKVALGLLSLTIVLGVGFLTLELSEFIALAHEGNSWRTSAFLTAFFTLVATHGLHIFIGIIWAAAVGLYTTAHGATAHAIRKFTLFTLFWHFLDVVWIFIFTVVYMLGVIT